MTLPNFEFGSDRRRQTDTGSVILRAAFAAAAMFWNQLALLRGMGDGDFLIEPRLIEMRRALAAELNRMSETLAHEDTYVLPTVSSLFRPDILEQSRYSEYARNNPRSLLRSVSVISDLNSHSRAVELSAPSTANLCDALQGSDAK
jgi:hypothetical protein